ncbi:MAG: hypothetical protein RIQ54_577 [Candidatus Parcubacteria bacterium]|jgi:hypothetical protein
MHPHDPQHYIQLAEFIKAARQRSLSDRQIEASLEQVGWKHEDIEAGFAFVDADAVSLIKSKGVEATSHPLLFHEHGIWVFVGCAIIITALLVVISAQTGIGPLGQTIRGWIASTNQSIKDNKQSVPTQISSTIAATLLEDEAIERFEFSPQGSKNFYLQTTTGRTIGTPPAATPAPPNPYQHISLVNQGVKTGFAASDIAFGEYFDFVQLPELPLFEQNAFLPVVTREIPYIASDNGEFFVIRKGVRGPSYDAIFKLWVSRDGRHIAYSAFSNCKRNESTPEEKIKKLSRQECTLVLVVDDKEQRIEKFPVVGSFSPITNKFAFVYADDTCKDDYNRGVDKGFSCSASVVDDTGREGPSFDFVRSFGFTEKGLLVYIARVKNKEAVFVDGRSQGEFDGINSWNNRVQKPVHTGIFSPDGVHVVYSARIQDIEAILVDGIQLPAYMNILGVTYMPDGSGFYYGVFDGENILINTVVF